ncbi:WhiB family transcriptional regulator [Streptosporangiaceae bacterium NEAU-GS5]|nr:WhiB family transcriptional regulator [Streptosporangiaceae bacterium NEAU-GS5]
MSTLSNKPSTPVELSDWRDAGLCAQVDPDLFFPDPGDRAAVIRAKSVCAACPVRFECLTDALTRNERFGVWGGLSERDRRNRRGKPLPHRCRHCHGPVLEPEHWYCSLACRKAGQAEQTAPPFPAKGAA